MENNHDLEPEATPEPETFNKDFSPKLFSDEPNSEDQETNETLEGNASNKLFDQDINEEEDFEIPAFLRRQKF